MGCVPGDRAPYVTASLIFQLAEDPELKPYVRGKLVLAGIDMRVPVACWFDAVYAILAEAPIETLQKMMEQIVIAGARARPDRATWGITPEQQALTSKAMNQGGARGRPPARVPSRARDGRGRPVG